MRSLAIFLGAVLIPVSAFAITPSLVDYCLTTVNPTMCITDATTRERDHDAQRQQALVLETQLEQARIQANGMALFGAGNALINGMNQQFQNMQLPYVDTPYFTYPNGHR